MHGNEVGRVSDPLRCLIFRLFDDAGLTADVTYYHVNGHGPQVGKDFSNCG